MRNTAVASSSTETPDSKMPIVSILFLFLFGSAFGYCWWVGDRVAAIAIAIVAVGGLLGFYCGLWRTLASSVGMFLGYELAAPTAVYLNPFLQSQLNQTIEPKIGLAISGFAAGSIATLFLVIVGVYLRRNPIFRRYDQRIGFAFGLASTSASLALVFWVLLASERDIERSFLLAKQDQAHKTVDDNRSLAQEKMSSLLTATKASYVMVPLKSWNPFVDQQYFREWKAKIESSLQAAKGIGESEESIRESHFVKKVQLPSNQEARKGARQTELSKGLDELRAVYSSNALPNFSN